MQMKRSDVVRRSWNFLRLALLWARKGGVFNRKLITDLTKQLKSLRHNTEHGALHYGYREFSFEDTPIIHLKMPRPALLRFKLPHIPCINPQVDFDYDFQFNDDNDHRLCYSDVTRKSFLKGADDDEEEEEEDDNDNDNEYQVCQEIIPCDDEGIDRKADEFIAKFYQQMKLQRQMSYRQYNEMLNRGAS